MKRINVQVTDQVEALIQSLADHLTEKTGFVTNRQDVLRLAVVGLAKKEKVTA